MNRKWFFIACTIVLCFFTALNVSAGGQQEGAGETGAQLSEKHGGTLKVGQTTDIRGLDPTSMGQTQELFFRQVFDTLVTEKKDGSLVADPLLAESWEWSEGKTKLRLNLRQGVTFHSGREMKAEDVIKNIEHVKDPATGSKLRRSVEVITRMEAVDDYTVDLYLEHPYPAMFDMFTMLWIIDPEVFGKDNQMVGTGPFEYKQWIPGNKLELVRYDDYWDGDLPYLDQIVISAEPDAQTMIANLEAGSLDMIKLPPLNELPRLEEKDGFKVAVSPVGNAFYAVSFNCEDEILGNKKVRQALSYSMDRKRFVDTYLYGYSTPQSIHYSKQAPAYEADLADYYKFDLDKAQQLLEEAGYGEGFDTQIMTSPNLDENSLKFCVMWQQDLEKIGVNLEINQVERAVWVDNKRNAKFPGMLADLYGRAQKEPVSLYTQSLPFLPDSNPSRFVSQRYKDLVAAASREPDKEKRLEIYHDITMILLDEAFEIPLAPQTRTWAMKDSINGFDYNIDNREVFRETWIKK
jgi:peptide/nickel transport system substrate-binding protein